MYITAREDYGPVTAYHLGFSPLGNVSFACMVRSALATIDPQP